MDILYNAIIVLNDTRLQLSSASVLRMLHSNIFMLTIKISTVSIYKHLRLIFFAVRARQLICSVCPLVLLTHV